MSGMIDPPHSLKHLFSQINVFKIIEMLHDGLTNIPSLGSTSSFGKVIQPLADTLRNTNSDHLIRLFLFFSIALSYYMLINAIHIKQKQTKPKRIGQTNPTVLP